MKKIFCILMMAVLVTGGCSLLRNDHNDDETERTYPEALKLKSATVQKAKNQVVPPDSINVDAYVINIIVCPPDFNCFLPDGIIVSDSLDSQTTESKLFLTASNPRQFDERMLFRISLKIAGCDSCDIKDFRILGYSRLP